MGDSTTQAPQGQATATPSPYVTNTQGSLGTFGAQKGGDAAATGTSAEAIALRRGDGEPAKDASGQTPVGGEVKNPWTRIIDSQKKQILDLRSQIEKLIKEHSKDLDEKERRSDLTLGKTESKLTQAVKFAELKHAEAEKLHQIMDEQKAEITKLTQEVDILNRQVRETDELYKTYSGTVNDDELRKMSEKIIALEKERVQIEKARHGEKESESVVYEALQNDYCDELYNSMGKVITNLLKAEEEADQKNKMEQDDRLKTFAKEALVAHTLHITSGEGGTTSPSGEVPVTFGDDITVNFQPSEHYIISSLLVDGIRIDEPSYSYTFQNVLSDHSLVVGFAKSANSPQEFVPDPLAEMSPVAANEVKTSPAVATVKTSPSPVASTVPVTPTPSIQTPPAPTDAVLDLVGNEPQGTAVSGKQDVDEVWSGTGIPQQAAVASTPTNTNIPVTPPSQDATKDAFDEMTFTLIEGKSPLDLLFAPAGFAVPKTESSREREKRIISSSYTAPELVLSLRSHDTPFTPEGVLEKYLSVSAVSSLASLTGVLYTTLRTMTIGDIFYDKNGTAAGRLTFHDGSGQSFLYRDPVCILIRDLMTVLVEARDKDTWIERVSAEEREEELTPLTFEALFEAAKSAATGVTIA